MRIPAVLLILLLCLVRNVITFFEYCAEINGSKSNGSAIPIPNTRNPKRLVRKLEIFVESAKRITKDAGLQGSTMIPKKSPNRSEVT